jgi:hypothetical protein
MHCDSSSFNTYLVPHIKLSQCLLLSALSSTSFTCPNKTLLRYLTSYRNHQNVNKLPKIHWYPVPATFIYTLLMMLGASIDIFSPTTNTYTATKLVPPLSPIRVCWHIPLAWNHGPLTVTGFVDPSSLFLSVSLTALGISLVRFHPLFNPSLPLPILASSPYSSPFTVPTICFTGNIHRNIERRGRPAKRVENCSQHLG